MQPENTPNLFDLYKASIERDAELYESKRMAKSVVEGLIDYFKNAQRDSLEVGKDILEPVRMILDEVDPASSEIAPTYGTSKISVSVSEKFDEFQHNPDIDGPIISTCVIEYDFARYNHGVMKKLSKKLFRLGVAANGDKPDLTEGEGVWLIESDGGAIEAYYAWRRKESERHNSRTTTQVRRSGEANPDIVQESTTYLREWGVRPLNEAEMAEVYSELEKVKEILL